MKIVVVVEFVVEIEVEIGEKEEDMKETTAYAQLKSFLTRVESHQSSARISHPTIPKAEWSSLVYQYVKPYG